jgi:hypothetical protein
VPKGPTPSSLPDPLSTSTTPDEAPRTDPFEQSVLLRLDELSRQIERVLTLACPVCGPDLVKQIHPNAPVVAGGNGRAHGK